MAKVETITLQSAENLRAALQDARRNGPPVKVVSKREVVAMLKREISEMRTEGFSLEQIVQIMTKKNQYMKMSPATLNTYLRGGGRCKQQAGSEPATGEDR